MNGILGKLVGGTLGFALGGAPGFLFGLVIGHAYDNRQESSHPWADIAASYNGFSGTIQQAAFTTGVVVLSAKMAKADGQVTRAEIDAFKRVFQIPKTQEAYIGKLFDRARQNADGFEPYAFQLAQILPRGTLEDILVGLFTIALADNPQLSQAESRFLQRVAVIFAFDNIDFVRLANRAGLHMATPPQPRNPMQDTYAVLRLKEEATVEGIKTTYRTLIQKYHPDKLVSQGMPPEFVANATEKMKNINVAYDAISKARGIK